MNWKKKNISYVCLNVNIPKENMQKLNDIIDNSSDWNLTKTVIVNRLINSYIAENYQKSIKK